MACRAVTARACPSRASATVKSTAAPEWTSRKTASCAVPTCALLTPTRSATATATAWTSRTRRGAFAAAARATSGATPPATASHPRSSATAKPTVPTAKTSRTASQSGRSVAMCKNFASCYTKTTQ